MLVKIRGGSAEEFEWAREECDESCAVEEIFEECVLGSSFVVENGGLGGRVSGFIQWMCKNTWYSAD